MGGGKLTCFTRLCKEWANREWLLPESWKYVNGRIKISQTVQCGEVANKEGCIFLVLPESCSCFEFLATGELLSAVLPHSSGPCNPCLTTPFLGSASVPTWGESHCLRGTSTFQTHVHCKIMDVGQLLSQRESIWGPEVKPTLWEPCLLAEDLTDSQASFEGRAFTLPSCWFRLSGTLAGFPFWGCWMALLSRDAYQSSCVDLCKGREKTTGLLQQTLASFHWLYVCRFFFFILFS